MGNNIQNTKVKLLTDSLVTVIYDALRGLKSKHGEWVHHPTEFLPANVSCDFAGKQHFKGLLEATISPMLKEVELISDENERLKEALRFYANHIHWMPLAGGSELSTVMIAGKLWDMNGWAVAENALNEKDKPKSAP